ncbi:MAG: hypothetical protein F6J87_20155 [Spirulina sp. SIO3F2]|nr:hypothetical protein [Spirulina sp. SIO3F2]
MTFVDDLMDDQDQEERSPYPEFLGTPLTPPIQGVLYALIGLAGAGALGWYQIKPKWDALQALKTQVDEKQLQRQQLAQSQQKIDELKAELQTVQANQQQVLSLFSGEASFDTFLYTLNQRFKNRGTLLRYEPPTEVPAVIEDGTWGGAVNGLLKRQTMKLQMEASFEQTMAILRDIERLQTLAALKNIKSEITTPQERLLNLQGNVTTEGEPLLTTSFDLELLFPVSEEELIANTAPTAPADPSATPGAPGTTPPAQ